MPEARTGLARGLQPNGSVKTINKDEDLEMLEEYDFSGGVRGKYAARFSQGTNAVLLDPDVAV